MNLTASIIGGSGYTGGELIRLLLNHPKVDLKQVTSETYLGKYVTTTHPNLRSLTTIKFSSHKDIESVDVLFLCLPHGKSSKDINNYKKSADLIIDLSSDFRLRDKNDYLKWYNFNHENPDLLNKFVYSLPELHRKEIKNAQYISAGGCNATASILALYPLFKNKLLRKNEAIIEVKVGSSEGGKEFSLASHHPERSGSVRSYRPINHRHTAEIIQELTLNNTVPSIYLTATSIEMVRGVLATCHVFVNEGITEKDIWKAYRKEYSQEPFIRIVKSKEGIYRYPEPKILSGTNFCDIGFELDEPTGRLVVISAIDNLVKGSGGQAIQSMNIKYELDERTGLEFSGLHPI